MGIKKNGAQKSFECSLQINLVYLLYFHLLFVTKTAWYLLNDIYLRSHDIYLRRKQDFQTLEKVISMEI